MSSRKPKMDKVCDICGSVGFAEAILTCYQCKVASEHIYCMRDQVPIVPDVWWCEECKLNKVVHEGNGQDSCIERMSVKGDHCDLEISNIPVEKSPLTNYWEGPEQSTDDEKQESGTKRPFCSLYNSVKRVDIGKEKRVPVATSPDKPVRQQLSCKTSFRTVEDAKVKLIPSEEAAFLTFRQRVARRWSNLGASHRQTDRANGRLPPSSWRMPINVSTSHNPNALKVLAQPNEGSIGAGIHLSPVKHTMTTEHVRNDQEVKYGKRKASDIEASAGLSNKKLAKKSVGAKGCLSSTKFTRSTVSDIPLLPINDEWRHRTTIKALDEAPVPHDNGKHVEAFVDAGLKYSLMKHIRPAESRRVDYRLSDTNDKNEIMRTGNVVHTDASSNKSGFQEMNLPLTLITSPCEKTPNHAAPGVCWKGTFEVFDVVYHFYGIQAHFPCQVFPKAYEISKKLPEKLKLKILARVDAWPQAFQIAPPTYEDIGLYFFPSEFGRPKEKYIRLLKRIELRDFAMKTCVDGVELLMYTSKQLPQTSQRIDAEPFLWGVFRHLKHKKQNQGKQEQSLSCIAAADMKSNSLGQFNASSNGNCQEVDMEMDIVGGSEIGRTDRPILRIDAPPGFSKPISRDAPPGYAKLVSRDSPGFSKTISRDVSHDRRSFPKFLPDIPPGFSKTMRSKHGSRSPAMTFSGQNLYRDKRVSVSSSTGKHHATTTSEACEGKAKRHQVSGHSHKSVEHSRCSFSDRSAEKKKEFNSILRFGYAKEKSPPQTDMNPHSASIYPPSSANKKADSSSEKPLHKSCTIFREDILSSIRSSQKKQEGRIFEKPNYDNYIYSHTTDTEAHHMLVNITPNSSKEKGHRSFEKPSDKSFAQVAQFGGVRSSGTGIKESMATSSSMMVSKAPEGNEDMKNQSVGGKQERKMITPGKQSTKKVIGKEKMERKSSSNPVNKQVSALSAKYDSSSSSPIEPLLSGNKSRTDGVPESKTMMPDKWYLKEDIKGTKKMENQRKLVKGKKQLPPSYGTTFSRSKQPLLSTGSDLLPLLR